MSTFLIDKLLLCHPGFANLPQSCIAKLPALIMPTHYELEESIVMPGTWWEVVLGTSL